MKKKKKDKKKDYIYLSIIAAIVIVLGTIIIILLTNNKDEEKTYQGSVIGTYIYTSSSGNYICTLELYENGLCNFETSGYDSFTNCSYIKKGNKIETTYYVVSNDKYNTITYTITENGDLQDEIQEILEDGYYYKQ